MKAIVRGVVFLCAVVATTAVADTAVLANGARLRGEVRVRGKRVEISTENGLLTLPAWRVSRVEREAAPAQFVGARQPEGAQSRTRAMARLRRALTAELAVEFEETPLPEALARIGEEAGLDLVMAPQVRELEKEVTLERTAQARSVLQEVMESAGLTADVLPDGALRVRPREAAGHTVPAADMLERRIDVDFEDIRLDEALEQIRQLTGANLVIGPEVRGGTERVELHLRDMPLETVLEFLLEPHGYAYAVKEGEILHVGARHRVQHYTVRVYPVADLLLDTGDVDSAVSGGSESRLVLPQFGSPRWNYRSRDEDREDGRIELHERTADLMMLMNRTCARRRWWFHGPGRRGEDRD